MKEKIKGVVELDALTVLDFRISPKYADGTVALKLLTFVRRN